MDKQDIAFIFPRDNHWAFLDEIEAPMWVDLTLESKSNFQSLEDDGWFHTTHMFHQCSSLQLKAAFAHSSEGCASSDLNGPSSSPKLPSSVSRSRGKDFAAKKRGGNNHQFLMNVKHPVKALSGKSSEGNSEYAEEMKPKLSFINSKGALWSNTALVVEKDISKGDSRGSLRSRVDKASQSNTSTITSDNDHNVQQRNLEVSSQAVSYSSGLVSAAMRLSLRKSCGTRQASRVDVSNNNSRRQTRDSNSASGKSSVGSSSNPGSDVRKPTLSSMQHKDQSPKRRNEAGIFRVTKYKEKDSYVSRASNVQVKGRNNGSRREGANNASKPAQKEVANSKVQSKTLRAKALLPHRVNEHCSLTGAGKAKEKARVGGSSRMIGAGSENLIGRVPLNQKCTSGNIGTRVMAAGQTATKQNVSQKNDRTRSLKGMIYPSRGKHSTNATQIIYLR